MARDIATSKGLVLTSAASVLGDVVVDANSSLLYNPENREVPI
jgi:carbonic anhydrase/acetyltransferase-like protein (isoleucine patch superfamily)